MSQRFKKKSSDLFLYGTHACEAALKNLNRRCFYLYVTHEAHGSWKGLAQERNIPVEVCSEQELLAFLPKGAVHQGVALKAAPLAFTDLDGILKNFPETGLILVLDQISDPQNMGAIIRSAAAFKAHALIFPKHQSSPVNATVAKAASGALELVPLCAVSNLAQALDKLKKQGFWCYGLAEGGEPMNQVGFAERTALVIGAEGRGMRSLTKEKCDHLVSIPTGGFSTLNASNAAAVALYQWFQSQGAS